MSNPFAGIITAAHKELFKNMIDALLEDTALTLPCQFIYTGSAVSVCPNCVYDPMTKKSSNRYKVGGLVAFPAGQLCPVCNGLGKITLDSNESFNMMVIYNSTDWVKFSTKSLTAQTPSAYTLTFSKIELYPNIKQCDQLVIDTRITDTVVNRYNRVGEPEIMGWGESSYILTKWNKITDGN